MEMLELNLKDIHAPCSARGEGWGSTLGEWEGCQHSLPTASDERAGTGSDAPSDTGGSFDLVNPSLIGLAPSTVSSESLLGPNTQGDRSQRYYLREAKVSGAVAGRDSEPSTLAKRHPGESSLPDLPKRALGDPTNYEGEN